MKLPVGNHAQEFEFSFSGIDEGMLFSSRNEYEIPRREFSLLLFEFKFSFSLQYIDFMFS